MVEDGWTPTDIEEPAATLPSTVGRHSRSARPTADNGWTLMDTPCLWYDCCCYISL